MIIFNWLLNLFARPPQIEPAKRKPVVETIEASRKAMPWDPATMHIEGKVSTFGGWNDKGVSPGEGLALVEPWQVKDGVLAEYFLRYQPEGSTGLARRLDQSTFYLACRWDYGLTPKGWLRNNRVLVTNLATGKYAWAQPIDWGPHATTTDKAIDLSPGLAKALGLTTGDQARVAVPLPSDARQVIANRHASGLPATKDRAATIIA